MKTKKLWRLVHGMSSREQSEFIERAGNNKSRHDLLLFNRILSCPKFSKKTDAILKGEEFQVRSKFSSYKKKLGQTIIESTILGEGKHPGPVAILYKSIELEVSEVGKGVLVIAMRQAQKVNSYSKLRYFYHVIRDINLRFRIAVDLPKDILGFREVGEICGALDTLVEINSRIRTAFKLPFESKRLLATGIFSRLEKIEIGNSIVESQYMKAKAGCSWLIGDYDRTYDLARRALVLMEENESYFGKVVISRELWFLTLVAMMIGDREAAYGYYLSQIKLTSEKRNEENALAEHRVYVSLFVGEYLASLELIEQVLPEFERQFEDYSDSWKIQLLLKIALAYFYHAQYQTALVYLQRMRQLPAAAKEVVRWEISLLIAICALETESFDLLESHIGKLDRLQDALELQYPNIAIDTVRGLYHSSVSQHQSILSTSATTIKRLMQDMNEYRSSIYFQISPWIHSKLSAVPQYEIIKGLAANKVHPQMQVS